MATRDIAIKCPVCLGKCKDGDGADCKPCAGKGILWGKETDEQHQPVYPWIPFWYPVYPQPTVLPAPSWPWDGIVWSFNACASDTLPAGDAIYSTDGFRS